jgi:hypothetical protein
LKYDVTQCLSTSSNGQGSFLFVIVMFISYYNICI